MLFESWRTIVNQLVQTSNFRNLAKLNGARSRRMARTQPVPAMLETRTLLAGSSLAATSTAVNDTPVISKAVSAGVTAVTTIQAYNVPNSPGNGGFNSAYGGLPGGQVDGREISGFAAGDVVTFSISGANYLFTLYDGNNNPLSPFAGIYSEMIPGGMTASYTVTGGADTTLRWFLQGNPHTGGNPSYTVTASAVSGSLTASEDMTTLLTGLSVSDVDSGSGELRVSMSVQHGSLGLLSSSGLSFVDSNGSDGTLVFTGTQSNVNAALAGLQYTGNLNFNGQDSLQIVVNDQGHTGTDPGLSGNATSEEASATFTVDVAPVNDAPVIAKAASAASTGVTTVTTIQGYNVPNSPGNGGFNSAYGGLPGGQVDGREVSGFVAGDVVTFSISGANYLFTLYDGNNNPLAPFAGIYSEMIPGGMTASYTVTGGADTTLRWFLQGNPHTGGNPSYTVTASAVSYGLAASEDTAALLTGLSVSDVDAGSSDLRVSLGVQHGSLALLSSNGLIFTDNNGSDGTLVFTGAQANINAALAALQYTGNLNFNGQDSLQIVVNDQGHTGTDPGLSGSATSEEALATFIINVAPVNDAPVVVKAISAGVTTVTTIQAYNVPNSPGNGGFNSAYGGLPGGQVDGREISGFAAGDVVTFSISGVNYLFTLYDGNNNPLAPFAGIGSHTIPNGMTASYTVTGGADTTLRWFLQGNPATGGNPSYTVTASAVSGSLTASEDMTTLLTGLSVSDVDSGSSELRVSLSVQHGSLGLLSSSGLSFLDSNGSDGTLAFTGSQSDINAVLAGLKYTGSLNFVGQDSLQIVVNDQGHTGADPGLTGNASSEEASATFLINVAGAGIQQQPDPQNPQQTMIVVTGTGGNDLIYVYAINGGYRASINGIITATLPANSRVLINAQEGNDRVQYLSGSLSLWIDGGDGNDTLTGGNGNDVIFGGGGHDVISGKKGVDAMFGGAGNDSITGTGILVGGNDVDTLTAFGPRNVMIGGLGADILNAATGTTSAGDLMIGSWTDHDENLVALQAIRAEWASGGTLDQRIDHITGRVSGGLNGSLRMYSDFVGSGGTVHNDNVSDLFRNVNASDWRFLFSGDALTSLTGRINHLV